MEKPKKKKNESSWGQIQFGGVDRSEDKTNFIKRESDTTCSPLEQIF